MLVETVFTTIENIFNSTLIATIPNEMIPKSEFLISVSSGEVGPGFLYVASSSNQIMSWGSIKVGAYYGGSAVYISLT